MSAATSNSTVRELGEGPGAGSMEPRKSRQLWLNFGEHSLIFGDANSVAQALMLLRSGVSGLHFSIRVYVCVCVCVFVCLGTCVFVLCLYESVCI
jgi:hypothetical protein